MEEINEKLYQQIKKKMCKNGDYFNEKEVSALMQFLMQRQQIYIDLYRFE